MNNEKHQMKRELVSMPETRSKGNMYKNILFTAQK